MTRIRAAALDRGTLQLGNHGSAVGDHGDEGAEGRQAAQHRAG